MQGSRDLRGKAAIVTGAARNLGRGFAHLLATRGANVVVHYNAAASARDAEQTAALVREAGAQATLVQADLTATNAGPLLVEACLTQFGRLDILVNNAGLLVKKPFHDLTDEDFARSFALNARAPFELMRAASQHMAEGGSIINVGTSILACSFPHYAVYAASKASLEHFSRALAKELAAKRINVNTIAPGALETPFFYAGESQESAEAIKHFTGGLGRVEDVVPLLGYLVSPEARWMTGQTVFINGAFAAR